MAQCLSVLGDGTLQVSAADPCTSFVMLTPAEYGALSANPFNLSLEDGSIVAGAVAAVWISAWCIKALILTLRSDGVPEQE